MAKYFYVVLTKKTPEGDEAAFHEWYDDQHLGDCVAIPGITAAKRYRLLSHVASGGVVNDPQYNSLAIYEMETDDPIAVAAELSRRAGTDVMPLCAELDRDAAVMHVAVAAGDISQGEAEPASPPPAAAIRS